MSDSIGAESDELRPASRHFHAPIMHSPLFWSGRLTQWAVVALGGGCGARGNSI